MKSDIFKNRLFHFFLHNQQNASNFQNFKEKFSFGDWVLYIGGESRYLKIDTEPDRILIFVGDLFFVDTKDPKKSDGHFICIDYTISDNNLNLFRSKNSSIGIYYAEFCSYNYFWGDMSWAKENLQLSWDLDIDSIANFFSYGIISTGKTIFKKIFQLPFKKNINVKNKRILISDQETLKVDKKLLNDRQEFYEFILFRFNLWIRHCHFNSMALSGGADSRLIFATLSKYKFQKDFSVHTRLHPELSEGQDADVVIASNICSTLHLEHKVQRAKKFPAYYLSQDPPALAPIFSGLYGGEYLGGEVVNILDSSIPQLDTRERLASYVTYLSQAFTCDLYNGAWFPVFTHHNLTLTPFWDSYLIEYLYHLKTDDVINYKLYNEILEFLPKNLLDIPYQSQLTHYHPRRLKASSPLINPKSLPLRDTTPEVAELIFSFESDHNNKHFKKRSRALTLLFDSLKIERKSVK